MHVRYSYLSQQFADIGGLMAEIEALVRSGDFTLGEPLARFEASFAALLGARHAIGVGSGTDALKLPLRALGIGPGDEVITTANTFIATVGAIAEVGATPVFVDCEPSTRNIDLGQVEQRIGPRTKAILPTHFAGLPCDMDRLYDIARRHRLRVIEDAALAIGSSWRGQRIGAFGDLICFSFHPNKNMTTIEGGALVVNDDAEALAAERWRFHGIERLPDGTRDVGIAGLKANMPDVHARVGVAPRRLRVRGIDVAVVAAVERPCGEHGQLRRRSSSDRPC